VLVEQPDRAQGALLRVWLNRHLLPAFEGRILAVDTAVARRCAKLHVPDERAEHDALIAATASAHGLTVVMRNVGDLETTNAGLLNPWA
jgi:toxin FitB